LRKEIEATAYQMALFAQATTNTNRAIVTAEDRLATLVRKLKRLKKKQKKAK
jgi:hypothetical protein